LGLVCGRLRGTGCSYSLIGCFLCVAGSRLICIDLLLLRNFDRERIG
jgi:hypothetical protein